jgi:hypothetical protein
LQRQQQQQEASRYLTCAHFLVSAPYTGPDCLGGCVHPAVDMMRITQACGNAAS